MSPSVSRRVVAGLSRLSSSYLYRSSFIVPLRFSSAKPMDKSNTSSDSVSGKSSNLRASSNESGHSYKRVRPGSVNIEPSERCNTVFDYEDDFPPLVPSCYRSKARNADREVKRDDLVTKRTHDVNSSKGVPSVSPRNNSSFRGDASVYPSSKISQVLPTRFGMRQRQRQKQIYIEKASEGAADSKESDSRRTPTKVERLNICRLPLAKIMQKGDSLGSLELVEFEKTAGDIDSSASRVLRSGMVLLKSYISLPEQVQIVKTCNQLGEGPGGFYRPGYEDGAKLRLYMMCLGQNWDPQTGYQLLHPVDNCVAPAIPLEFVQLVERSIKDARVLIKECEEGDVALILPSMSPDICIANFYTNTGRLGLHQDRDESQLSRRKGLPVVSFSIGDSAVFLFGDERDAAKAEQVTLESGDVLLFGGKSRMVFHGVPSVMPDTAPAKLREESGLLPGRLNLTFRQY